MHYLWCGVCWGCNVWCKFIEVETDKVRGREAAATDTCLMACWYSSKDRFCSWTSSVKKKNTYCNFRKAAARFSFKISNQRFFKLFRSAMIPEMNWRKYFKKAFGIFFSIFTSSTEKYSYKLQKRILFFVQTYNIYPH